MAATSSGASDGTQERENLQKTDDNDSKNKNSRNRDYPDGVSSTEATIKEEKDPGEALESALAQLGHFRLYQRYNMIMLCLPNLLAAMYTLNYVFVADQVPFRCVVPECEGTSDISFVNESAQALLPADSRCRRYSPLLDGASCDRDHFHLNNTQDCDMFVYENLDTTFAEFGLACSEWRRTLVGTVRNSALPLALLLTGYISDAWGRRTAFCIFSFFAGLMGIIKAFSVNYQMYVAVEFFEAALGYGFNSAAYIMMVELARPSLRAAFSCATGVAYGLGGVLFALIAWLVPYWRRLLVVIHTPALLLPLYWLLVDESARWLHVTGKTDKTAAVIRKAARWNKITLDEEVMKSLEKDCQKTESQPRGNPWASLLRSRVLLGRFAVCCWCWVATTFVYYGLTINSVSLSGDKYVNFALNMSMEVVASLLIMMALERFGRRRSIFIAFLLCGVACVTPYFVSHTGTGLGLFFVGKLAITFAFNSVYVFTAELFPTGTRSSALAACSLVGRLGSILAPQTPLLNLYVQALLYGACSLTGALAVLAVPETRRARLPLLVDDAERMRRDVLDDHVPPPPSPPRPTVLSADS
ncbi:organic cation transporter protein-like [Pectinophora gossypiella]|uniref:organic cation transporter protein-like n=1 Tax=Pectinophora gossypiella TaxID=13191 RepID=UPI00214E9D52|nr:organic cation transporter protein-like [Pectinophora gossypiella]